MAWENLPSTNTPINATNLNKITDSGSNTNGYYIKYQDGTLIQYGYISKDTLVPPTTNSTTVQGIIWYRTNNVSLSFPISFKDTNYSFEVTVHNGVSGTRISIPRAGEKAASNIGVQLITIEPVTSGETAASNLYGVSWLAIGKWM